MSSWEWGDEDVLIVASFNKAESAKMTTFYLPQNEIGFSVGIVLVN